MKYRIAAGAVALMTAVTTLSVITASSAVASTHLPCSPTKGDKVGYHGGLVVPDPQATLIFWGSWWQKSATGAQVITEMQKLFNGLYDSPWANTLSQYCDLFGEFPQSDAYGSMLAATYIDPINPPTAPTPQQMADEAAREITPPIKGPFINGAPMIITPPGVTPVGDGPIGSKTAACGRHGWDPARDRGGNMYYYQYADVPYGVISATPACYQPMTVAQELSAVASHEWAETVTDPFLNGSKAGVHVQTAWASSPPNGEIGDLCETHGFWLKLRTGTFWMEQLWSNEAGTAPSQGECVKGSP
jgi:hypothetical protein